jgi:hypothetical protein
MVEGPRLDEMVADVFRSMGGKNEVPIVAMYYPYAELKSTIKIERNRYYVRISDAMREVPDAVVKGVTAVLFSKLHRRLEPTPYLSRCVEHYREWLNSSEARQLNLRVRRLRGHKKLEGHAGKARDLGQRFDALNRKFFAGELQRPLLTWTAKKTCHTFGHHDEALDCIVISKSLDDDRIPEFVLDYVLYHEMLHLKLGSRYSADGRRLVHTAAFRKWEEKFPDFEDAEQWLEKLAARRGEYGNGASTRRSDRYASKRVRGGSRFVVRTKASTRKAAGRLA